MKASHIVPDKNVSMLLKGGVGMGKTLAATSFALYGDVYLAYFDKKVPIELFTWYTKIGRKDLLERIDYDVYGSTNVNDFLNKMISLTKDCRYVAVIVDSVTNLTTASINWSMGFRDKDPKQKKGSSEPSLIPGFDDYKVETSLVTQALDICKTLPVYNIWTAHPLPKMQITGSGSSMNITQTTAIVSYGNKVGAIIPGGFTEVYQFGRQVEKRLVWTDMVGDDYAKSAFNLPKSLDITNKLFAEVWKEAVNESLKEVDKDEVKEGSNVITPSKWKI